LVPSKNKRSNLSSIVLSIWDHQRTAMAIKIQDYATTVQMKQIGRLLRQGLLDLKMEKIEEK
jgi:hypothetical protein